MDYLRFEKALEEESFDIKQGFEIIKGSNNILLSAPHSAKQLRDGKEKHGEYRMGTLVKMLSHQTGCHVMYKTKCLEDDANYDESCDYKSKLIDYVKDNDIKLVLDFHIASPKREFSFDLGTGRGKNLLGREDVLEQMVKVLENHYPMVGINHTFSGAYPHTVSSTISRETNIPAIQIEANWNEIDEYDKLINLKYHFQEIIHRMSKLL